MALTYGFYDSLNHDRTYNAEQISSIFNGIINDGIFENIGTYMVVSPGSTGLSVNIAPGRAWFNGTWSLNDSIYMLDIGDAPFVSGYSRIDAICLKVNKDPSARENSYVVVTGTETSQTPSKPELVDTDTEFYHPLAYITIKYGDTSVIASQIENVIGTETTPFITGILETADITELLNQWQAQWDEWLEYTTKNGSTEWNTWYSTFTDSNSTMFSTWFENIKGQLSEDAAGKLQTQIDALQHIYVDGEILYLPNTEGSVSSDGILTIGTQVTE